MMSMHPPRPAREGDPGKTSGRTGFADRVEAASRLRTPAPKGRGIVMILLAVVVLGALIWDFTGHGAASRAMRDGGKPPVAPGGTDSGHRDAGPLEISLPMGKGTLRMSAPDAVRRFHALEGEDRETFRAQMLAGLTGPAGTSGPHRREAFEVATGLVEGAGPASQAAIRKLRRSAWVALGDDDAAPAAALFLTQLPDAGGAETREVLDEVILDAGRPLLVRVAAARARTKTARPPALKQLATDPATHPSLRDALK